MRYFIIFFIFSMVYFINGQNSNSFTNPAVNPFVNPSFTSNHRPNTFINQSQQQTYRNPLTRLLGWFGRIGRKSNNNKETIESNTQSLNDDFSNSLPKESTDRMISDAIADRILEESREQQTIVGSPFIKESNNNLLADDHQADENENVEHVIDREGYGKSVANTPTDTLPLAEALRIVNTSNLSDCVARVICELSCNANSYGDQGRTVFRNLIKLQFDQNIKSDDAKSFRQAASKGRQIVQGKRNCNECYTIYPSCKSSSKDLVAVSSMFKL